MNGSDLTWVLAMGISAALIIVLFFWFYRSSVLVRAFLKAAGEVLGERFLIQRRWLPVYNLKEIEGVYKGRDVAVGIRYAGLNAEFLPLPYVQMSLKPSISYNYDRLPNYAKIIGHKLFYQVKLSVLWGVFDKSYPHVFSKNYLIIALERLLATAEDIERDRQSEEVI